MNNTTVSEVQMKPSSSISIEFPSGIRASQNMGTVLLEAAQKQLKVIITSNTGSGPFDVLQQGNSNISLRRTESKLIMSDNGYTQVEAQSIINIYPDDSIKFQAITTNENANNDSKLRVDLFIQQQDENTTDTQVDIISLSTNNKKRLLNNSVITSNIAPYSCEKVLLNHNNYQNLTELSVHNNNDCELKLNMVHQNNNTYIVIEGNSDTTFTINTVKKSLVPVMQNYNTSIVKTIFGNNLMFLHSIHSKFSKIIGNDNLAYILVFQTTIILALVLSFISNMIIKMLLSESNITQYIKGIAKGYINDNIDIYSKYAPIVINAIEEISVIYLILPFFCKGITQLEFIDRLPLPWNISLVTIEEPYLYIFSRPLTTTTMLIIAITTIISKITTKPDNKSGIFSTIIQVLLPVMFQFFTITITTNMTLGSKLLYIMATQIYLISKIRTKLVKLI